MVRVLNNVTFKDKRYMYIICVIVKFWLKYICIENLKDFKKGKYYLGI